MTATQPTASQAAPASKRFEGGVYAPPAFNPEVYRARRQRVLDTIGCNTLVVYSPSEAHRTHDLNYRYRPDSDVYYLTGFDEPDSVVVLTNDHPDHKFVMFVRPRDPERETWDGIRAGVEGAATKFGADAAYTIGEFPAKIGDYLNKSKTLYYRFSRDEHFNQQILGALKNAKWSRHRNGYWPDTLRDTNWLLGEMRLRKDEDEVERMRRAADIAVEAHCEAMRAAAPGKYEFEIEAVIEYTFRRRGAFGSSYTSIVGSGANATILHYNTNDRLMQDGDLLLVDAGSEYGYYASDITRTYPVNGKFTEPQKHIYEVVLRSQLAAIEKVKPGNRFLDYHVTARDVLIEGLIDLGLLEGSVEKNVEERTFEKFYMHRAGHWLGSDVHDASPYMVEESEGNYASRIFEPGMVVTVEPGLYFQPTLENVPAQYLGIGIRIEDDILVTADGNHNLTAGTPKTVEEIEAWMGK
ncbi:MAG: aminopeptidase P N-terminal domain-containing protein [Blastocatellia bacterium]|nr:aminopeptidase P N-terminal domain-containing protein [Blastocatellia bacterium]